MYDNKKILDGFAGLIGFPQGYDAATPVIDDDLQVSISGIYVDSSLHDLITYPNILTCAEQFNRITVRNWLNDANYKTGSVIQDNNKLYRAVQDNTGKQPSDPANVDFWAVTNQLSNYLRSKYNYSVLTLMNSLFTEKKLVEVAKSLLASGPVFYGQGQAVNRNIKLGRICGLKLQLMKPDTVVKIHGIALQLDAAQPDVPIYLYHSSSVEPIQVFHFNQTKTVTFEWHKITAQNLYFSDFVNHSGGYYYIVYYESDLIGTTLNVTNISFDGNYTCATCGDLSENSRLYHGTGRAPGWGSFLSITPFYVDSDYVNIGSRALWDLTKEIYPGHNNYGFNFQLSIQCDVSDILVANSNVLVGALAQQLKVTFLKAFRDNTRFNQAEDKIAALANASLGDQKDFKQKGEVSILEDAKAAVNFDLSGINSICLPCKKSPIRAGTIYS